MSQQLFVEIRYSFLSFLMYVDLPPGITRQYGSIMCKSFFSRPQTKFHKKIHRILNMRCFFEKSPLCLFIKYPCSLKHIGYVISFTSASLIQGCGSIGEGVSSGFIGGGIGSGCRHRLMRCFSCTDTKLRLQNKIGQLPV